MTDSDFAKFVLQFAGAQEGGFKPFAWYCEEGDLLEVYLTNEVCYGKWLGNGITVMKSQETDQVVGIIIDGVKGLIK